MAIKCLSLWPLAHVLHEGQEALSPLHANGNAPSSVILVLLMILVRASLNHLSPTRVSACQTCATCFARTYRSCDRLEAAMMTNLANHNPTGIGFDFGIVFWVCLAQHKNAAEYLHLNFA
jgi:hypothetical protein